MKRFPSLVSLGLGGCWELTDEIGEDLSTLDLQHVDLSDCSGLHEDTIWKMSKELKSVALKRCSWVTDQIAIGSYSFHLTLELLNTFTLEELGIDT